MLYVFESVVFVFAVVYALWSCMLFMEGNFPLWPALPFVPDLADSRKNWLLSGDVIVDAWLLYVNADPVFGCALEAFGASCGCEGEPMRFNRLSIEFSSAS